MAKQPWEEEVVDDNEIKVSHETRDSAINTPLLTALLGIFFVTVVATLFVVFYTSNRGSDRAPGTSNFYGASSSSVVPSSSKASSPKTAAEATIDESSTDTGLDDTAEPSSSTGSGGVITVLSGEGAASIAARAGISVETLYELNPGHMISGCQYANPGDEVYINQEKKEIMGSIRIAVDGPASSGKSTVAKIITKDLDYTYPDAGVMYRSATYLTLQNGLTENNVQEISEALSKHPISFGHAEDDNQTVFAGDRDVILAIRQDDVTNNVSWVAAIPEVRRELVEQRRHVARNGAITMDGHDIGTVILPDAELKTFLIASVEERAERRSKENQGKGIETNFETLKHEIAEYDYKGSYRRVSPLKAADDAITFDTTGVDIDGAVKFTQEKAEKIIGID